MEVLFCSPKQTCWTVLDKQALGARADSSSDNGKLAHDVKAAVAAVSLKKIENEDATVVAGLTGASSSKRGSGTLVPDGRIQGRWTQKRPSKISCGQGSQRPRKWPSSKYSNCGLILTILGKNWPKNLYHKFFTALFLMILGVAGLRPKFFSSGRIFLAELAQESWRDLAAVKRKWTARQNEPVLVKGEVRTRWRQWQQTAGERTLRMRKQFISTLCSDVKNTSNFCQFVSTLCVFCSQLLA